MKEFLKYVKVQNFHALFLEPSNNLFIQMFRYLFVGGGAFLVDTGTMCLLSLVINKYIAVAVGFVVGLVVNFALSKAFVFKKEKARVGSVMEFVSYGVIGLIGLGLTEGLIYVFTDVIPFHLVFAKIIAAAIVLLWNFAARKVALYSNAGSV